MIDGSKCAFASHSSTNGPSSRVAIPKGWRVLDAAVVTPGLIDCHTHLVWAGDRADDARARAGQIRNAEITPRLRGGNQACAKRPIGRDKCSRRDADQ